MASTLKINTLTGVTTAGSIAVTGEGNSTTTNLQQGLAKQWIHLNGTGTIAIVDSFNTNGFTVLGNGNSNNNGDTYVAWCWKAGDHDDNLPQINTEGTIDSIVSVNAEAGFSIVKYTGNGTNGATIGHGLSSAPELIITKGLSTAYNWNVVTSLLQNGYLELNMTSAFNSNSSRYITASATTNNLTDYVQFNQNNIDHIAYCFHSVTGYQKIGSYTGNGGTNTITTGFEPRFLMIKKTSNTGSWVILDSARETTNPKNLYLFAETNGAESDVSSSLGYDVEFLTDGFEPKGSGGDVNASGQTYIYLAIK